MKHTLWLLIAVMLSSNALADESCSVKDGQDKSEACKHAQWRVQATMSDDSRVLIAGISENIERVLPQETVTLWALPPVPMVASQVYAADELKPAQVKVKLIRPQFKSALAELEPVTIHRIAALVEQLKDKRNLRISVVGHTDNQRLSIRTQRWYKDNKALSEARAKAVANYFQQALGLSSDAITSSGKGATQPIASNATLKGMAKNRRVEMNVWYDEMVPGVATTVSSPAMNRRQICRGKVQPVATIVGGFRVSVDGQPVDNGAKDGENVQRCTDVALSQANVRLQYDNLSAKPKLDVSVWNATATASETIKFQGYSNYLAWVERAEVRIFADDRSVAGKPLAVVALDDALAGEWRVAKNAPHAMQYRIRVYDKDGRYDETTSLPLWRVTKHNVPDDDILTAQQQQMISYGHSRLETQSIPVVGGSITVHGDAVPVDHRVLIMGQTVPVDAAGKFVAQQIIPRGQHTIEVAALNQAGDGELFWRDIELKKNDWFYVGIIDVTAGRYRAHGEAQEVTHDRHLDNSNFVDGRLAFYTKGKWREKYTVTVSADTREQRFSKLFSTIMDKDPRSLLRRLDDTAYYPTYGDDSTLVEDAPTQGKFYAKIEDERSQAMWGNFKIVQQETDLAQINRGLYGGLVDWNSKSVTPDSQNRAHVNAFVATPGTQAAREEFRGTGGSLYYLQHQDIVSGAERVQVEVRDKDSGIVLNVNTLVAGQDYQEDAIQGRILLTRPLPSTADDSQLVRAGSYAGNPVYLVVDYEYVGNLNNFNDLAVGGRATYWLADSVRVGFTGTHQQRANQNQNLNGLDVIFRKTPETYVRLEAARTAGPGVNSNSSIDGGFAFNPTGLNPTNNQTANAFQLESGFRFTDLGLEMDGKGNAYVRRRDKGFSAPGQLATFDTDQLGASLTLPLTEQDDVDVKVDIGRQKLGIDSEVVQAGLRHKLNESWAVSAGLRADNRKDNSGLVITNIGNRTDLALQADYTSEQDWGLYGFGQGTLNRSQNRNKNNRGGLGGHYQVNDRLGFKGETSVGNGGFGALIGTDYRISDRTTTYLNYALDPDNANSGIGNRQGKLVSGVRNRYSDSMSVYGEEQYLHGDHGDGLTHAYGVDLTPSETWKFNLAFESGQLNNATSTIKRRAASIATNYAHEDVKYAGNLEFRRDIVNGLRRDNWLTRNHLAYQVNPDWRMNLRLDLALSKSATGNFLDADYAEVVFGYAYRPVNNDKFNALLEYKYLADQTPAQQFSTTGLQNKFQQKSHVFAVDGIYDLTQRWSVGGKYAVRISELRAGRGTGDWFKSTAQLGVVRADWHVVKHWDALLEGRVLDVQQAQDRRAGLLTAIYRHIGDDVKVGVGYNFTDFSDALTNLNYDSRGVFFNVIGKL